MVVEIEGKIEDFVGEDKHDKRSEAHQAIEEFLFKHREDHLQFET